GGVEAQHPREPDAVAGTAAQICRPARLGRLPRLRGQLPEDRSDQGSAAALPLRAYRKRRCSIVTGRSARLISTIAHGEVGGPIGGGAGRLTTGGGPGGA